MVADIKLVKHDKSVLYVKPEKRADPISGVDIGLGLIPSRSTVELMLAHTGFAGPKVIPPKPPLQATYFKGKRALFAARVSSDAGSSRLS